MYLQNQDYNLSLKQFDAIIDLRSRGLEHWSYNLGIIREVLNRTRRKPPIIVLASETAQLFSSIGLIATRRREITIANSRFLTFLGRELVALHLLIKYSLTNKRILVLHAHPFSLLLSLPIIKILQREVIVCLHNDIIKSFRGFSVEDICECNVWSVLLNRFLGLGFFAPNKYFKRFITKNRTRCKVSVVPHPILRRGDYELVARNQSIISPRFDIGFFGQVEPERGLDSFLKLVDSKPSCRFVIAGRNAKKVLPRNNLTIVELPPTEVFCALLLATDSMFIDLRGDYYRVGESGTYWDSIALSMRVVCGSLPRLYKVRLELICDK